MLQNDFGFSSVLTLTLTSEVSDILTTCLEGQDKRSNLNRNLETNFIISVHVRRFNRKEPLKKKRKTRKKKKAGACESQGLSSRTVDCERVVPPSVPMSA